MPTFKCKMCGGTLEIKDNASIATCEYCGTTQTLPKIDDERKANLYDRANHFRRNNEFDKAMGIYEQILNEDNTDAEAYWSLVLCRYGIEYVEDPATHKRVPTVNRAQFTSVFDDDNYKSALQYADSYQKSIYEQEANTINEIQKGILAISQKEEPFDVFICYKETDNQGRRTPDSVLANDLYHQLTNEGFKVFFAAITLEDKLGTAYEPYIFAALNSAKVMVVLGTKPEYFNAVWVKNEWSRYLALVKNSGGKKMLIPAYKDMDPYDLPEEFSHLQAQDMSKLGFMQDLIRGIKKLTGNIEPKPTVIKQTVIGNTNTAPLLKRAFMFLEDGDWSSADEYCEKVLDVDPECAEAYLGKLLSELKLNTNADLQKLETPFDDYTNYQKAVRYGSNDLKTELRGYIDFIINRNLTKAYNEAVSLMKSAITEENYKKAAAKFKKLNGFKDSETLAKECFEKAENAKLEAFYKYAVSLMKSAETEHNYKSAAEKFNAIKDFRDSEEKAKICYEKAEIARKDAIYNSAISSMKEHTVSAYKKAIETFEKIEDWKDSSTKIYDCEHAIYEIEQKEEADRIEAERLAEEKRIADAKATKKRKRIIAIVTSIVCAGIAFVIVLNTIIIPNGKYNDAIALMNDQKYTEAISAFTALDDYKDSINKIEECNRNIYGEEVWNKVKNIKVGDTYNFGTYEQDNNKSNGQEEIEWLVLDEQDNKFLLISKYALDCKPYDENYGEVAWETCTLRQWLNNDFFNTAFTEEEKAIIATVTVTADQNPYDIDPVNETQDRVFLLSATEANEYFYSDAYRKCQPTNYVATNNALKSDNINCRWWLRSDNRFKISIVNFYGIVNHISNDVYRDDCGVRPALWVELGN